jgi:hypothetical protein
MEHNIIVIDMDTCKVHSVKPASKEQLQHMSDTEDFIIIDPLNNTQFIEGEWIPIKTSKIEEAHGVMTIGAGT